MRALRLVLVGLLVVLAACGSSSKNSSSGNKASSTTLPASTELGTGVTDTTLKIGVSLIDFDCIKQFTDSIRVDQQHNYQLYFDDINKNKGGIAGRQVQLVFHTFCPIHPEQAVAGCTQFTEDDKVFAVIGNVYDPSGDVQLCISRKHKTPVMTFNLTQAIIDKSLPGLIVFPGNNPERIDSVLAKFMKEQNTLAGKKIAVLGGTQNKGQINSGVIPALKTLNVPMGTTALLNIGTSGDTTQAQSQLSSFIERWKTEGVNALFVTGEEASTKQFVEKIKKEMPNVLLVTDIGDTRDQARQEVAAHVTPNPYEGMITTSGQTSAESDASENWKYCADIYKAQTGKDAEGAAQVIKSPDGKNTLDEHGGIDDACQLSAVFKQIGDRVGKYLNVTNWANTVNTFGPIINRGAGQYASLHAGHYDIDDTFRLVAFDSSLPGGDWRALTPLENVGS